MRKYRAWHKPTKTMYTEIESINFETKVVGVYTKEGYRQLRMSDFEIMESTGLLDKNEKEIFEKDITKIPVDINQERHGDFTLHEIEVKNGTYITSYLISEKGQILPKGYSAGFILDHYEYDNKSFLFNTNPSMDTEIEVVGNIYENLQS